MLRAAVVFAAAAGAVACQSEPSGPQAEPETLKSSRVSGFAGVTAAHGADVAEAGRTVLARNGTAADAAVAMAYTAAVTVPSRAGLGGGGVCLLHRRKSGTTKAFLFPAGAGDGEAAAPALTRAMAILHDRHGRAPWDGLMGPARRRAHQGFQVSRVLAQDFDAAGERLGAGARRVFGRWDGNLPGAGDRITRPALAATLTGLREQGPGYVHTHPFVPRLLDSARAAGFGLNAAALNAVQPRTADTLTMTVSGRRLHLPPPPALGGLAAGQTVRLMDAMQGLGTTSGAGRAHLAVEALKRAWSQQRLWNESASARPAAFLADARIDALAETWNRGAPTPAETLTPPPMDADGMPPGTGFVVADRFGSVVACGLTMNGLFGTGKMAQGTGVLLAPEKAPAKALRGLVPALFTDPEGARATGGFVAADGGTAPGTLAQVLDRLAADDPVAEAVATPRAHHPGRPDVARVTRAMPWQIMRDLRDMGHEVRIRDDLGTIAAIVCPPGADGPVQACQPASDARGSGAALRAE